MLKLTQKRQQKKKLIDSNGRKQVRALRERIDALDDKILKMISQRGRLAIQIGHIKRKQGKEIYVPSREREIMDRLARHNAGPFHDVSIHAIFREIISASRSLENPTVVAYLGPEATFTHMASVKYFGHGARFVPQVNIATVFTEVEKEHVDFGVVPVENSTEGVVNYTLDKFVESDLKICSEIIIGVSHHLLSTESDLSRIRRVYSHPQALAQCRQWIVQNLPEAELRDSSSTASAAKRIMNEPYAAAIASSLAADMFGLNVLVRNIQDQTKNFTRFLVIGRVEPERTGNDKTSVVFVAKDRVGVLYHLLRPLAKSRINLTKIESRPRKNKAWEYLFFVDLDGHMEDPKIREALQKLSAQCEFFKILGSYPKSIHYKKRMPRALSSAEPG